MELRTRPLTDRFGPEVRGVDLANMDCQSFDAIYRLRQRNPLLLLRRQSMTERAQVDFTRSLSDLDLIVRDDMHSPRFAKRTTVFLKPVIFAAPEPSLA